MEATTAEEICLEDLEVDGLDNFMDFMDKIKPSRKGTGKVKKVKRIQFMDIEGYAKFKFRDCTYVRLNNRLALNLNTKSVEFMEVSAHVVLLKLDYLHGIDSELPEDKLISQATIFVDENGGWDKPVYFTFKNTDLQAKGIGAKRALELAKAGLM